MATAFWGTLGIFRLVFCYLLSAVQLLVPAVTAGNMASMYSNWTKEDSFSYNENTIVLEKAPDKDFVVLNLTDIQLDELEVNRYDCRAVVEKTIAELVKRVKPDLITVTGDNAWGMTAYLWFAKYVDSFNIPWAPVMGNHDGQHTFSEEWCCAVMMAKKNCLFQLGPNGMGQGNYIITITENGKPVHQLYMMDTHGDGFYTEQVEWYEWAVKGMEAQNGTKTESTVLMHIPTEEYQLAWNEQVGAEETDSEFGARHERICWEEDNGMFEKVVELGSTTNFLAGHDHINNFKLTYNGIGLNYGLHTGIGCYWEETLSGGTVITIGSDGKATFTDEFVDPQTLGVWYDENINPNS